MLVGALALVAAACGDDDDSSSGATTTAGGATTTAGGATTTAGGATTTAAGGATTTAAGGGEGGVSPACEPNAAIDAVEGENAGQFTADIQCAEEKPLKAEGEPIVIGLSNHQGDPNGSFPEMATLADAAVKYINEELGGLGSNVSEGRPGRPIQLETCFMAVNPADSQKCANELAGKDPFAVISTINFFGNNFPIYAQAGIENVLVGVPITIGDFTSPGVASVGAGGGCLGVHTGLVYRRHPGARRPRRSRSRGPTPRQASSATTTWSASRSRCCKGAVPGDSELAGSMPDLEHIGVPIKPATPDVTPQVTQVLDFDPNVIIFSAQGADCWNFVDGLGRAGWTVDDIPLILSSSCIDLQKMEEAGDLANGIYFVGAAGASLTNPDVITDERLKLESTIYVTKGAEYGAPEADIGKTFGANAWSTLMTLWEQSNIVVNDGAELTPETFHSQLAGTSDNHIYGSVPFGCADASAPYVAVCNSKVSLQQWDGDKLNSVIPVFSGTDLIAGTELTPGP